VARGRVVRRPPAARTRHAGVAPITWSATLAAPGGPAWQQSLLWLIQPPTSLPAAITAAALLLAGVLTYATRTSPPTPPGETATGR